MRKHGARLRREVARQSYWGMDDEHFAPVPRHPVFPPVICALTGAPRAALARRRTMALTLLDRHPAVSDNPNVAIYVCFLDELKDRGPYAPIFRRPEASDQAVNWIGEGGDSK